MTKAELLQNAKPILFNTEMVRAILDGRKTVTRRAIKLDLGLADTDKNDSSYLSIPDEYGDHHDAKDLCKYQPGDILYVRETWKTIKIKKPQKAIPDDFKEIAYLYKADGMANSDGTPIKWHPSIHMPKEAARIFLKVTGVSVERLQEITEEQAVKEGCREFMDVATGRVIISARGKFNALWRRTIKKSDLDKYGWDANPWVWVIEFERISI